MDIIQLYCGCIVSIVIVVILKSFFEQRNETPGAAAVSERRHSQNPSTSSQKRVSEKPPEYSHDVRELRHLSVPELQNFNVQCGKTTDRYWREIFRRQNDSHDPDHLNVSRLQTGNIITALDEHFPQGYVHETTITGLVPKPFSSRKCEVLRYLRERVAASPGFELIFEGDQVRIVPSVE